MYPALAVLKALQVRIEKGSNDNDLPSNLDHNGRNHDFIWVGGEGGIESELLAKEEIPCTTIPAAGVHGVGLKELPGNLWKIVRGFFSSKRIIREFRPQVIFFTGGYLAVPVAAAGRLVWPWDARPKVVLYVPDIEPGLALQVIARFSDLILLTVEDSMKYFQGRSNLKVTGYPTRLSLSSSNRHEDLDKFNLSPNLPTLLVFGGSKGARSINQALLSILRDLLVEMQIIHISGQLDWPKINSSANELPINLKNRYHAFPYLYQEMAAALNVADLVVSRAGASVLGEFPLYGLPAILIPYPHAWRYQEVNATFLENRGAALVLQDHQLDVHLYTTITKLMKDVEMRNEMGKAMSSLATPQAAETIAIILRDLVSVPGPGGI